MRALGVLQFEVKNQVVPLEAFRADPVLFAMGVNRNVCVVKIVVFGITDVCMTSPAMVVRPFWIWLLPASEPERTALKRLEEFQYFVFAATGHTSVIRSVMRVSIAVITGDRTRGRVAAANY
jgi:hypothetical protein